MYLRRLLVLLDVLIHLSQGMKDNRLFGLAFLGNLETMVSIGYPHLNAWVWWTPLADAWSLLWPGHLHSQPHLYPLPCKIMLHMISLNIQKGLLSAIMVSSPSRSGYLTYWWYVKGITAFLCIHIEEHTVRCIHTLILSNYHSRYQLSRAQRQNNAG